jgi:hypothetical protein
MVKKELLPLVVQVGVISRKAAVEGELHRLLKTNIGVGIRLQRDRLTVA